MNKFRYLSYLPLLCSAVWMQSGYAQGLGKPSSQGQGGNAQQQQVAPANQAPVVNVLPAAGENGYKIGVGISDVETVGIDTPEDLQRAEEFLASREK